MDELGKVKRVIERLAPVGEVLLVLDATTGQNGLTQARIFREVVDVTGIVLTKLDGSAKGGIVVQVQRELGVPVKLVGLGEGVDDLAPFDATVFVDALLRRPDRSLERLRASTRRIGHAPGPDGVTVPPSRQPKTPAATRLQLAPPATISQRVRDAHHGLRGRSRPGDACDPSFPGLTELHSVLVKCVSVIVGRRPMRVGATIATSKDVTVVTPQVQTATSSHRTLSDQSHLGVRASARRRPRRRAGPGGRPRPDGPQRAGPGLGRRLRRHRGPDRARQGHPAGDCAHDDGRRLHRGGVSRILR